jgi:hypothetical protein
MAKRYRIKRQAMVYNLLQGKKTAEQQEPPKNGDEVRSSGRVSSSCTTSGTRRVTPIINAVIRNCAGIKNGLNKHLEYKQCMS